MCVLFFRRSFPEGDQESLQQDDEPKSVEAQRRRDRLTATSEENKEEEKQNTFSPKGSKVTNLKGQIPLKSSDTPAVCFSESRK